jgi:non-ribosomal peptide synthetase component F
MYFVDPDSEPGLRSHLPSGVSILVLRWAESGSAPRIAVSGGNETATTSAAHGSLLAQLPPAAAAAKSSQPVLQQMYALTTSGSTAAPKIVCGTTQGLWNRSKWAHERYAIGCCRDSTTRSSSSAAVSAAASSCISNNSAAAEQELLAVTTPLTFVDSLWQVFGGWCVGVAVLVVPARGAVMHDTLRLARGLTHHKVTLLGCVVPTLLKRLCDDVWQPAATAVASTSASASATTAAKTTTPASQQVLPLSLRLLLVSGEPFHCSLARTVSYVLGVCARSVRPHFPDFPGFSPSGPLTFLCAAEVRGTHHRSALCCGEHIW